MSEQTTAGQGDPELFTVGDDEQLQLVISRCARCASPWFPARTVCGACGSSEVTTGRAGPNATVYASTMIRTGPPSFQTPYCLAYLDVDDLRVLAQVQVGGRRPSDPPLPGTPVQLVLGAVGEAAAATYVAKPLIDGGDHDA